MANFELWNSICGQLFYQEIARVAIFWVWRRVTYTAFWLASKSKTLMITKKIEEIRSQERHWRSAGATAASGIWWFMIRAFYVKMKYDIIVILWYAASTNLINGQVSKQPRAPQTLMSNYVALVLIANITLRLSRLSHVGSDWLWQVSRDGTYVLRCSECMESRNFYGKTDMMTFTHKDQLRIFANQLQNVTTQGLCGQVSYNFRWRH